MSKKRDMMRAALADELAKLEKTGGFLAVAEQTIHLMESNALTERRKIANAVRRACDWGWGEKTTAEIARAIREEKL